MDKIIIEDNPDWAGDGVELMTDLGFALENGTIFKKNYSAALHCYHLAACYGDSRAMNNLGWMTLTGMGTERDVKEAQALFEAAAMRGEGIAMVNLGYMYENGLSEAGVDERKAFQWYKRAAEAGDAVGLFNYANCLHWGWGTKKNRKKAFPIFLLLAEHNYESAFFYVGLYYQEGYGGCRRDYEKARMYYRFGALKDDHYCLNQLGVLYGRGLGVKKDVRAAMDYYKMAAELGDATAHSNIGWFYESGALGKPDLQAAAEWYAYGALGGDEQAKEALKRLGLPLPINHIIINDEKEIA